MCCFFNKAYLRIPFDIIKKPKVILLYHCWNHVLFSFIVVKDAASHSTNYSLPRGGGVSSQNFQTNYPKHQGIRPAPPTADNLGDAERNAFSTPPTKNINQFMPKSCQDVWDSDLTNTKLFES